MNNGKICVSVCAKTADEFVKNIKRAEEFADVVELRFDCLKKRELETGLGKIFRQENDKHLLVTFRPKEQGGNRLLSKNERDNFWSAGYDHCWADLEEDVVENSFNWLFEKRICSYHDFDSVPQNLFQIYERLKATSADIIKIAVQADEVADSITVWKLLEKAKSENKQIIPIAMGASGKWTRILGLAHGAFMTYASLEAGTETASGQITAQELVETYRVKELNEQTEIYGIIGNPVSHSVSPEMHNAAFKFHNLNAVYIPFEVKDLKPFLSRMVRKETREIDLNFRGFSVTIPHKQAIIPFLDFVDETARVIGAVNTVKIEDGKFYGYNTDAEGFIEPLQQVYGDLKNAKIAVLGAGGAARAAVYALKKKGAIVKVFARDLSKGKNLANEFEVELKEFPASDFKNFDILINTTPIGMKGRFETETPVAASQIENLKLVYDLVYNPFETRLIKEARKANIPTIGGLAMLVAQGMKQFEIWTGKGAPMKEMSEAALRKLNHQK